MTCSRKARSPWCSTARPTGDRTVASSWFNCKRISSQSTTRESSSSASAMIRPPCSRSFPTASKITFPLLSDPDSKTIDAYHIRNKAAKGKAEGVPQPGTFILDREGVIRASSFLEGFRERHTTEELVKAATAVK